MDPAGPPAVTTAEISPQSSNTTEDVPPPPELTDDDVPFEPQPRRLERVKNAVRRIHRKREKPLTAGATSIFFLVYAAGASGVGYFGTGLLLFAWLMVGPLGITVYLTFDGRGSLLNPYTLFFSALVAAALGAQLFLG